MISPYVSKTSDNIKKRNEFAQSMQELMNIKFSSMNKSNIEKYILIAEEYREKMRDGILLIKDFNSYFKSSKDGISDLKNYLYSKEYSTLAQNMESLEKKLSDLNILIGDLSENIMENDNAIKDIVRNLENFKEDIVANKPTN